MLKLKSTGFVAQQDRRKKEIKDDLTVWPLILGAMIRFVQLVHIMHFQTVPST